MLPTQVIQIHPLAPPKPPEGAPCNGCGVCCLVQACPLGVMLSGSHSGPCSVLRWQGGSNRYACGAIVEPRNVIPRGLQWIGGPLAGVLPLLARRWIAAGQGCDSSLEPQGPPSTTMKSP